MRLGISAVSVKPCASSVFDEHALAARVVDHVLVGHPIRHRDHYLVARIHQRLNQVEDHVLAAHRDHALGWACKPCRNPAACRSQTAFFNSAVPPAAGVLGEILFQRADGRLLDIVRSWEVRLAGPEIDHVHAFAAKPVGFRRYLHRRRHTDGGDSFCDRVGLLSCMLLLCPFQFGFAIIGCAAGSPPTAAPAP